MTDTELDQLSINTIRTLSIDAVQAANSGHPGTPMAMAPVTYQLWNHHLRFDPDDAIWPNRCWSTRSAAFNPNRVASTRSRGVGEPPRWTWPSTVTRVS